MVGTKAGLAGLAIDHRVVESGDVPAGYPSLRMLDNRGVDADDLQWRAVGARRGGDDHVVPPGVAEVVLEQDAQRAVVPEAVDPAVDLRGGVDEAAALAEGDDGVHGLLDGRTGGGLRVGLGWLGHGRAP